MIERIIEFSAHNRFLMLILTSFAVLAGVWSMRDLPLDAIPDLSDTQVIVYSRWDRSPDIVEDQVTYPIVTAMLGAPKVKAVRGFSDFGYSFVYIVFDEGTDLYWARSRTTEYPAPSATSCTACPMSPTWLPARAWATPAAGACRRAASRASRR